MARTTKRDDLCNYCCEEDHEICFEFKPNSECACCADTVRLNSKQINEYWGIQIDG